MAGGPGVERTFETTTIENWFQLTEPGKYFVNARRFFGILTGDRPNQPQLIHLLDDRAEGE